MSFVGPRILSEHHTGNGCQHWACIYWYPVFWVGLLMLISYACCFILWTLCCEMVLILGFRIKKPLEHTAVMPLQSIACYASLQPSSIVDKALAGLRGPQLPATSHHTLRSNVIYVMSEFKPTYQFKHNNCFKQLLSQSLVFVAASHWTTDSSL